MLATRTPLFLILLFASIGFVQANVSLIVQPLDPPVPINSVTPSLASAKEGVYLSWVESKAKALKFSRWNGIGFSKPADIYSSKLFYINWADFPSMLSLGDDSVVATWLEKSGAGPYDYDTWFSVSNDQGQQWSQPRELHGNAEIAQRGFSSFVSEQSGQFIAVWIEARYAQTDDEQDQVSLMSTRFRKGRLLPETRVDGRTCTCCQTSIVKTKSGLLAAYRDRTAEEIRDIAVVPLQAAGWGRPVYVHHDNWRIPGCPVNGPQITTDGDQNVAVAWFTVGAGTPQVKVAFSADEGRTFESVHQVDGGKPIGRVDIEFIAGGAVVSWLERAHAGMVQLRAKWVASNDNGHQPVVIGETLGSHKSGFPRLAKHQGQLFVVWTELESRTSPTVVRMAKILKK